MDVEHDQIRIEGPNRRLDRSRVLFETACLDSGVGEQVLEKLAHHLIVINNQNTDVRSHGMHPVEERSVAVRLAVRSLTI
jgi:hypothetical protein